MKLINYDYLVILFTLIKHSCVIDVLNVDYTDMPGYVYIEKKSSFSL